MKQFLTFALLFLSGSMPPLQGLYDTVITPKWYMTGVACLVVMAYNQLPWKRNRRKENKLESGIKASTDIQLAAMLILACNLLYSLVVDILLSGYDFPHPNIKGVYDNSTGFAINVCLFAGFACSHLLDKKHSFQSWKSICSLLLLISTLLMVFISGCRSGLICMAIYCIIIILYRIHHKSKIFWFGSIAGFILITGIVIYVFSVKQESTNGREFIIERTWNLIKEKPLTGYGWNGFERNYMPEQARFFQSHPDSCPSWYADEITHPLNEFLYLWTDFGIIAPLLLLMLLAAPFLLYHHTKDSLLGLHLPSLFFLCVFSLTSYPFLYPLSWMAIGMSYAVMLRHQAWKLQTKSPRLFKTSVLIACCAGILFLLRAMTYEHEWSKLNRAMERGYTAAVINRYDALADHYRNNPRFLYSYMSAQYRISRLEDAIQTYQQLKHHVSTYDMELLAGDACRHLQRTSEALTHYQFAHAMVPARFAPLEGMMYSYLDAGRNYEADSVAHIILSKPVKVPSLTVDQIKEEARKVRNDLSQ